MTSEDYYNKLMQLLDSDMEILEVRTSYNDKSRRYRIGEHLVVNIDEVESVFSLNRVVYKTEVIPLDKIHFNYFLASLETKLYNLEQNRRDKILDEFMHLTVYEKRK